MLGAASFVESSLDRPFSGWDSGSGAIKGKRETVNVVYKQKDAAKNCTMNNAAIK